MADLLSPAHQPLLASLLEISAGQACFKDGEHRWVAVNDAFCALMGRSREELLGKKEADYFPAEFTAPNEERENAVLADGQTDRSDRQLVGADGKSTPVLVRLFRVVTEDGTHFVGTTFEDVMRIRDFEKRLNESEQRHQVIFRHAPVGIAYIGRNGRFRDVNPRFARILGYELDEILGQNYEVLIHADEAWSGKPELKRLLAGEMESFHFERKAKKKDGGWIEASVSIAAIKSESGKTDSAVVVLDDISERKRAQASMQAQNQILEKVARNVPAADVFRRIIAMVTEDWKGVGCAVLSFDKETELLITQVSEGLSPEKEVEFLGVSPDELFAAPSSFDSAVPIRSGDGTLLGAFAICRGPECDDNEQLRKRWLEGAKNLAEIVMERKHIDQKILEQQVQLFSASRMVTLGEMAAGIAHEINNPLAVIHGRAGHMKDLIEKDKYDAVLFAKGMVKIEETAMRIAKIIKGLRSFAREGSADPFQPAKMADIISDAFEFCRARFLNHEVTLEIDGAISEELLLECRTVQVGQVLLNLLSNAFDAVQALPERWVKVQVRELTDAVEIAVVDSGKGIPPGIRDRIMEPFFTTKEVGKGTGLGLSIVRGIVENHRGRIRVDTQSPNTRFVVTLPRLQAAVSPPESSAA